MTDIVRPISPSVTDKSQPTWKPEDLNPDLAAIAMAREYTKRWPTPTVINDKHSVYQGIWMGLNHSEENPTFYDCSLRIRVFEEVGKLSVNKNGKLFNSLFAYWMKPNYIIQGMPNMQMEEEKPGLVSRLWGKLTGKGSEEK